MHTSFSRAIRVAGGAGLLALATLVVPLGSANAGSASLPGPRIVGGTGVPTAVASDGSHVWVANEGNGGVPLTV